jgi:aerobic carbon-monoxide dehydrogenase large subunit
MLQEAFARSPLPHARVVSIDIGAAEEMPGVVAVYIGKDMVEKTKPVLPLAGPPGMKFAPLYALAMDKVRFAGDPVAMVVAASRCLAEDACELIEVDYEPIDGIANVDQALDPAGPFVFDELGTNVIFEMERSFGEVDTAFAEADLIIRESFTQHRIAHIPMECRGGVADFNPDTGEFTFYAGTQSPHSVRGYIAECLELPLEQVRVINGDIGGAFGLKLQTDREALAICAASKWLGRPVKWVEDRNEHLLASGQAREGSMDVEAAVKRDGTILALRGDLIVDVGAYTSVPFPGGGIVQTITNMMPGPYSLQGLAMTAKVVVSNKCTYSAYRGPWAMETFARERMINVIAQELDLDPAAVRFTNFAKNDGSESMLTGHSLLGTSSAQSLERALELARYEPLREEQAAARKDGRCVGIGFATFIEAAPGPNRQGGRALSEKSTARIEPDGHLSIFTSQAPHGQSHETTLAQVASDELGIPMDHVRIVHGDTSNTPYAMFGTGGSRAATMANGSVLHSTRQVKQKVLAIAAEMLEVSPSDLLIENGVIRPTGVPSVGLSLAEVAQKVYDSPGDLPEGVDASLEGQADYDGGLGGWSGGTHLCHVELDLDTGLVEIIRYLVVEDCGRMVNPAVVEWQIRGGIAQGIGEVL